MHSITVLGALFGSSFFDFGVSDQMCPQCDEHLHGCRKPHSFKDKKKNAYDKSPISCSELSTISTMEGGFVPSFVYSRRKQRGNSVAVFSAQAPENAKTNVDCLSAISSEDPLVAAKLQHVGSQAENEAEAVGAPVFPPTVHNIEPHVLRLEDSEPTHGFSIGKKHSSDEAAKNSMNKTIEVECINDSCSSSKSNIELVSASTKTDANDVLECSSSSVLVLEDTPEDPSGKYQYLSLLKRHGFVEGVRLTQTRTAAEDVGIANDSSCPRSCNMCGLSDNSLNMLICDNCEEAFHVSCCNPRPKKIPTDEWFCHSCLKRKQKISNGKLSRKSLSITREIGRSTTASSKAESNPIALMLEDTEPYTTGVRIGKGFQAEVPEWSGPIDSDIDTIGEHLEIDPINCSGLNVRPNQNSSKPSRLSSIGNWLQCRAVADNGNGTICGIWRRAPLFEVQTDSWECFCSVLWDPVHSDCAVPQELETDQVLKQLKYIERLRPRLVAKRQKLDCAKTNGPQNSTDKL